MNLDEVKKITLGDIFNSVELTDLASECKDEREVYQFFYDRMFNGIYWREPFPEKVENKVSEYLLNYELRFEEFEIMVLEEEVVLHFTSINKYKTERIEAKNFNIKDLEETLNKLNFDWKYKSNKLIEGVFKNGR